MIFQRAITPTIVIADQPTEQDLGALEKAGFVAVVNLRNDGEPEQPLSPEAEGAKVRALGLDYIHMGVGAAPLQEAKVDEVCKFLDDHKDGKVLVHCRKGGRAAAIVLIQQALAHGWSTPEAVAKGKEIGLDVDGNLRVLVDNYLDDHRKRE
jgi:uncharacterized protein (TIGR01244 family)